VACASAGAASDQPGVQDGITTDLLKFIPVYKQAGGYNPRFAACLLPPFWPDIRYGDG
jgi:hypothetical protein